MNWTKEDEMRDIVLDFVATAMLLNLTIKRIPLKNLAMVATSIEAMELLIIRAENALKGDYETTNEQTTAGS